MRKASVCGWHLVNDIACTCCGDVARVLVTVHSDDEPWGSEMDLCYNCEKLMQNDPETEYRDEIAKVFSAVCRHS